MFSAAQTKTTVIALFWTITIIQSFVMCVQLLLEKKWGIIGSTWKILGISLGAVIINNVIAWVNITYLLYVAIQMIVKPLQNIRIYDIFYMVTASQIIPVAAAIFILTASILTWKANINIQYTEYQIAGLNLFINVSSLSPVLKSIVRKLNVISCWYVYIIAVGISTRIDLSIKYSIILCTLVWVVSIFTTEVFKKAVVLCF